MAMGVSARLKGEIRVCQHCGQPYEPREFHQKYCSERCGSLRRGQYTEKREKICPVCHKSFLAYSKATIYCSNKCRQTQYQIAKGFKATKRQWDNLREFILERDNYICQDCGKFFMDIGLEAHHIKPLFKGGINTEENLVTLCHKCHKRRHQIWKED